MEAGNLLFGINAAKRLQAGLAVVTDSILHHAFVIKIFSGDGLMRPHRLNFSLFNHHHLVRTLGQGRVVGQGQHGAAAPQVLEHLQDAGFVFFIQVGRGLIQNHQPGLGQHGPGDLQALAFPEGKGAVPIHQKGIQALGQALDHSIQAGGFQGFPGLALAGAGHLVAKIFPQRGAEQDPIRRNQGRGLAQVLLGKFVDVLAVQKDFTLRGGP